MNLEYLRDKIYDEYFSKIDEKSKKEVRDRVHWITQNVYGNEVLDVGCSQGIIPILLGREGKKVLGLDISTSAIENAKKNLLKEEVEVRKFVTFEKGNFFLKSFEKQYDTVILNGVLEQVTNIDDFFNKAVEILKDNGHIIVTTTFGISKNVNHKRTFYLRDFIKLQEKGVSIQKIEFFGKWIGVVYVKTDEHNKLLLNEMLMEKFEESIYLLELEYFNKIDLLKKELEKTTSILYKLEEYKKYKNKYIEEKVEKVQLQKELIEQYNVEELLINEKKELSQKYELLQHRYNNIKNSTLGRLTVKYWKWRNRRRKK